MGKGSHLLPLARFGSDNVFLHPMSYTEEIWGGRARMIEMGQPVARLAPGRKDYGRPGKDRGSRSQEDWIIPWIALVYP